MTKIILVRHGETKWNLLGRYQGQTDIALSDKGLQQAQMLAERFSFPEISAAYSSDLQRAYKTASCVANRFSLPVTEKAGLREMNFGDWEGLTYTQIEEKWPKQGANFFVNPEKITIPAGESFSELQQRGLTAIEEIVDTHPGETVLIAAHGAIIRTILAEALHMPLQYIWSLRQDNTAVNIIRYDEQLRSVELLNSTAHLQK